MKFIKFVKTTEKQIDLNFILWGYFGVEVIFYLMSFGIGGWRL